MHKPALHEPPDHDCPFCRLQQGLHNEHNQPADVVANRLAAALGLPRTFS